MQTKIFRRYIFKGTFLLAVVISAFAVQQHEKWIVPESAKKQKNPVVAGKENMAEGKALYVKHCKSCHGAGGKGDGTKAKELDTPCGDFSSGEFHKQTDGEIFYKTKEGRTDMPSFKKKITDDEDIWIIVNYIRTLSENK